MLISHWLYLTAGAPAFLGFDRSLDSIPFVLYPHPARVYGILLHPSIICPLLLNSPRLAYHGAPPLLPALRGGSNIPCSSIPSNLGRRRRPLRLRSRIVPRHLLEQSVDQSVFWASSLFPSLSLFIVAGYERDVETGLIESLGGMQPLSLSPIIRTHRRMVLPCRARHHSCPDISPALSSILHHRHIHTLHLRVRRCHPRIRCSVPPKMLYNQHPGRRAD